jgi:hypothetical protein
MNRLKQLASRTARWTWFGLLVLLAFGYLAAGLSQRPQASVQRAATETVTEPATQTVAEAATLEGAHDEIASAVARVDAQWRRVLNDRGLRPADAADWLTVCRRMSMALVGNGLSLEEIRRLEALPITQRESTHLRNLLNDPRFHHYWAERWTRYLVGTDEGQFIVYRRRRFRIWLAEAFAANRRYDQMVRDLITAEGLWTDKPQVNFLTATFDSNDNQADPVRLAARTSRAFLGLRIDCLQCHNDFLGNVSLGESDALREGKQTDFHQLAAFYTSAKTNGLQGVRSGQVDYKYKYLNAEEEVSVEPAVPFRADLLPTEGNPRARLASWVTHPENRQSARAAVSHVWALLFGRPMGTSVDNLPLSEEIHPMLNVLADEFVASGFNLRHLITLIASSSAFRVDSRADFEITPEHEQAFAVFPLVRLRPEQVAGSVIQAARIKKTDRQSSLFLQLQTQAVTNDFVKQYGDMGEDEFTSESVTITQRLLMMNGQMIREIVESNPVLNTSGHLNMFAADDAMVIDTAYLCALNRYPTESEKQRFTERLSDATDRNQSIEDLVWVLVNSSEMAWNH